MKKVVCSLQDLEKAVIADPGSGNAYLQMAKLQLKRKRIQVIHFARFLVVWVTPTVWK